MLSYLSQSSGRDMIHHHPNRAGLDSLAEVAPGWSCMGMKLTEHSLNSNLHLCAAQTGISSGLAICCRTFIRVLTSLIICKVSEEFSQEMIMDKNIAYTPCWTYQNSPQSTFRRAAKCRLASRNKRKEKAVWTQTSTLWKNWTED